MEKLNGSITSDYMGGTREDFLFTYDESEKQENELNKEAFNMMLRPKFSPTPLIQLQGMGLNIMDKCLFGFIDFWLSTNERFFIGDDKLAALFEVSENTIGNSVKRLKNAGLIDISYKIKGGGGKIRFIKFNTNHNILSTKHKNCVTETQKLGCIENNIIENNINNISSSSDSIESSSEVLTNSNLLNSNKVLGDNDYTAQFDIFWKIYPHARKGKKQDAKKYFMQQDIESVMENVKLYKWKIELGIEDAKYVPACERWIRDFVPVNNVVKEQDLYKIVCKHMQMDGKKERYAELKNDFGTEKMDELVRKYNSNNKPTLYFK